VNVQKTLLRKVGKAIADFGMIRAGDRIAVGVSGGKDSLALVDALRLLLRRSPVKFALEAFTIEQGKFVRPVEPVGKVLAERGIPWTYFRDEPSFQLLTEQPGHGCDTCSRFRRRAVYEVASKLGCNVVALGPTADDLCEALLRNALFTGTLSALPPVTRSRSGDFRLIRPLVYVSEEVTRAYAEAAGMPVTPCVCSFKTGTVREKLRGFLADLRRDNPHVLANLLSAMGRIDTARLLDRRFLPPSKSAAANTEEDMINIALKGPASSPRALGDTPC
jgi:tRNA 2-thiocytidine biosynthesis protein TtcA